MLAIYFIQGGSDGSTSIHEMVGIMSGAVTNTPGLGAAQQTVLQVNEEAYGASQQMSMGYAAAYPLGVVGIILTMILIKILFKVDVNKEIAEVEDDKKASLMAPHRVTYRVTNELVQGLDIRKLHTLISADFVLSRIERPDGRSVIPTADDKIEMDDLVLVICSIQDEEIFTRFLGPKVEKQWEMEKGPIVSRRIVVTKTEYNGAKLGSLHMRTAYGLNVTRVNRAGVDLLALSLIHI